MADQQFCMMCGARLEKGAVFCVECGTPVGEAAPSAAPDDIGDTATQVMAPAQAAPAPAAPAVPATQATPPQAVAAPLQQPAPAQTAAGSAGRSVLIGIAAGALVLAAGAGVAFGLLPRLQGGGEQAETSPTVIIVNQDGSSAEGDAAVSSAAEAEAAAKAAEEAAKKAEEERRRAEEEEEAKAKADYVIADSATRLYSRSELEAYSNWDLYIARNEIYARHGRRFKNQDLANYFAGKSWYSGTIAPDDFDDERLLSETERKNASLMLDIEKSRNSPYLS